MARCWSDPPPDPEPNPVIVVPPHAVHGRLRDRVCAALGVDGHASDDTIIAALLLRLEHPA